MRSSLPMIVNVTNIKIAPRIAAINIPAPIASPTAAIAQIVAAMVTPLMLAPNFIIAPAPRNPTPDKTWAAIRPGSPF